jgi:hypothetical protein
VIGVDAGVGRPAAPVPVKVCVGALHHRAPDSTMLFQSETLYRGRLLGTDHMGRILTWGWRGPTKFAAEVIAISRCG